MDERIQKLVTYFTEKFGLQQYELERYSCHQESMYNEKIHYKCSLEFFPNATRDEADDDFNPPGTTVIDYNLTTEKIASIVFVNGQSFSTKTTFPKQTVQEVANWIEHETGYRYETDFFVTDTIDNGYVFKAEIDGIECSPEGVIEVEFDRDGKLTSFNTYQLEIMQEDVQKEKFTLTMAQIESTVQKQVQLVQFPNEETYEFVPVYTVDEVYVTNDGKRLIPYLVHERDDILVNEQIEWTTPLEGTIEKKAIDPSSEVPIDIAFSAKEIRQKPTIPEKQIPIIIQNVTTVLRTIQPNDSNKWTLATIRRDEHFIEVICTWNEVQRTYFNRKFIILLDPITGEVLNYMDNSEVFEVFDSFTPAAEAEISQEEAYAKLFPSIMLTPTYIYDLETRQFQLCGLLNASDCIHAVTGEIIPLDHV